MSETKRRLIACVIGTRPEVIKMAPVIFALQSCSWADVLLINTAQHRGLLDDMLAIFDLHPQVDLNVMVENQSLGQLTGHLCQKLDILFSQHPIDAVLAVGDTTTVMVSSLMAFYHRIPFGHIEAGLRTSDIYQPFPEEVNRVLTAPLSTWHFAPTSQEKTNLLRENIAAEHIVVTGNTVIDALYWTLKNTAGKGGLPHWENMIVVTTHRRENFGHKLEHICQAIIELSTRFEHIHFVFPVHPNPNIRKGIETWLGDRPRIHLIAPMKYDAFVHLMNSCLLILTDSGGIQEEAPALSKPVVVLRETTERPAILEQGSGILAGTDTDTIVKTVSRLLTDQKAYASMQHGVSPYGDGQAAARIVDCLERALCIRS